MHKLSFTKVMRWRLNFSWFLTFSYKCSLGMALTVLKCMTAHGPLNHCRDQNLYSLWATCCWWSAANKVQLPANHDHPPGLIDNYCGMLGPLSKQANIHTRAQWRHASVGLAQARPNEHAMVSTIGCHTPTQSPSSFPSPETNPLQGESSVF